MQRSTILRHVNEMILSEKVEIDILREIRYLLEALEEDENNGRFVRITKERHKELMTKEAVLEKLHLKIKQMEKAKCRNLYSRSR